MFRVQRLGLRVSRAPSGMIQGTGFRVQGSGFTVQVLEITVIEV